MSGTVKVDGKPLPEGNITFSHWDGKNQTTRGKIKDGQYSVEILPSGPNAAEEAPAGVMEVLISAPKVVGKKKLYNMPDSPLGEAIAEALPAKYNEKTELKLDLKPGKNVKDFDLQSK